MKIDEEKTVIVAKRVRVDVSTYTDRGRAEREFRGTRSMNRHR